MDTVTLRQRLAAILDEEERPDADWNRIDNLCERLSDDLANSRNSGCPHIVYHFLSDADIRAKDAEYGREQRVEIRRFAETGECDDSTPLRTRSCFAIAAVGLGLGALIYWLLS